jgi:hypothetical protein
VTVLEDSLRTSQPQPVAGSNETAFSVDASATTRAIIDQDELEVLRNELSGTDADDAVARIKQIAGVDSVEIEHSSNWLGGRMPRLDSRIQLEVVNATGVQAQTSPAGP